MKPFKPFDSRLPDPTNYFRQVRNEKLVQIVAGALLLVTVGVGAYLYAIALAHIPIPGVK